MTSILLYMANVLVGLLFDKAFRQGDFWLDRYELLLRGVLVLLLECS